MCRYARMIETIRMNLIDVTETEEKLGCELACGGYLSTRLIMYQSLLFPATRLSTEKSFTAKDLVITQYVQ